MIASYFKSLHLTAPGLLQSFQVTVLNSTSVRLDWALPSVANGVIRGFKVRFEKDANSSAENLPGNTTLSYVLTGLDKCTQYSFKMLAYTIKDGVSAPVVQKTTTEDGERSSFIWVYICCLNLNSFRSRLASCYFSFAISAIDEIINQLLSLIFLTDGSEK